MTVSRILASWLLMSLATTAGAALPEGIEGVSSNRQEDDQSSLRGVNQVRRIQSIRHSKSPEARSILRELREIEERTQRSQTGFNADPNHAVPYENHPWEQDRNLQQNEGSQGEQVAGANFKPMRIRFETKALDDMRDSNNAAKIDFIKNEILPRTASFWSQALAVVPVSGNLRISTGELDNREYCGDYEFTRVPSEHISQGVEGADLILYVSGTPSSRFCSYQTLAVAVACNFDQHDRPIAGKIPLFMLPIALRANNVTNRAKLTLRVQQVPSMSVCRRLSWRPMELPLRLSSKTMSMLQSTRCLIFWDTLQTATVSSATQTREIL